MAISDELLIRFLEKDLSIEEEHKISAALEKDSDLKARLEEVKTLIGLIENQSEIEPPASVSWNFQSALNDEIAKAKPNQDNWWLRVAAAAALLILGFVGGKSTSDGAETELIAMRDEIKGLQHVVMQSALQEHSASERLRMVSHIGKSDIHPDSELVNTLIHTSSTDKSPNVRYAAVKALSGFLHLEKVRTELMNSLESQTDPLIQIAIIGLLVEVEERAAISSIKKLKNNDNTSPEVRRQAEIAIEILI